MPSDILIMPPQAASLEQLERWLVAYYSEKAPEKLENVPKIARKMLNAQLGANCLRLICLAASPLRPWFNSSSSLLIA